MGRRRITRSPYRAPRDDTGGAHTKSVIMKKTLLALFCAGTTFVAAASQTISKATKEPDGFAFAGSEKFPFYEAIRPVSSFIYSLGKFAGGSVNTKDGKVVITRENAPDDLRAVADEYFSHTLKGWFVSVPGRMEETLRNDLARAMVRQNYGRFIEMQNDDKDAAVLRAYARAHPEKESVKPFAGDAAARAFVFEFPLCVKDLQMWGFILTPFTMRFEVRTFYDSATNTTGFLYIYTMGYEPARFEWTPWDKFVKDMREDAEVDVGGYTSPAPATVEKLAENILISFRKSHTSREVFPAPTKGETPLTFAQLPSGWVFPAPVLAPIGGKPVDGPGSSTKPEKPDEPEKPEDPAPEVDSLKKGGGGRYRRPGQGDPITDTLPDIRPPKLPDPPLDTLPGIRPPVEDPISGPGDQNLPVSSKKVAIVTGINAFDIAEDATHTYVAGYADGNSRILAVDKLSGETSIVYQSSGSMMGGEKGQVKRLMGDNRGAVLVEFSNHPVMRARGGKLSTTKLPDKEKNGSRPHLKGVLPDGRVVMTFPGGDNPRNSVIDPDSGEIRASTAKISNTEPKIGTVAMAGDGTIWEPGGGLISRSYSLISLFGTAAEPVVATLDTSASSPFKGRIAEVKSAPDGGVVLISGFGIHSTKDGGKTWRTVDSKTIFAYQGFDRIAVNSRSEVWAAINTMKGYTLVRYDAGLTRVLFRTAEFGTDSGGAPVTLKSAPKLLFVDGAGNLWIVDGTYGSNRVIVFNPAGLVGYAAIAKKKGSPVP